MIKCNFGQLELKGEIPMLMSEASLIVSRVAEEVEETHGIPKVDAMAQIIKAVKETDDALGKQTTNKEAKC